MSGTTPRRVRMRLFLITMVVMLGLVTHSTHIGTGDEPHYLAIAHSLAFDLDLDLSNNYGAAEPLIFNGGSEAGAHVVPGIGGIARPVHDVGMPMLFAPYVRFAATGVSLALPHIPDNAMKRMRLTPWTLYRNVLSAAMIGLAGLLAIQLFSVFLAIDVPLKRAFWSTLLVVLSPPILIFGALFFTELVTALLCVFVFRVVAVERTASAREWVLAGVATGLMVIVHARNLGLVLPLIAVAMWSVTQSRDFRKLALFAAPAVVLLGVRTAINYQFWGTYVVGPHARVGEWAGLGAFLKTFGVRIAGLFVDQEYGLLPYAPVFILCAFGVVAMRRSHPDLLMKIAFIAGCYLFAIAMPITNAHGWTGGWSPPARLLLPIVPLLAVGVAAGMQLVPRVLLVGVVALQVFVSAYFWQNPKNLWNDGDGVAAACARGGAGVCDYLPSFVHAGQ